MFSARRFVFVCNSWVSGFDVYFGRNKLANFPTRYRAYKFANHLLKLLNVMDFDSLKVEINKLKGKV